MVDVVTGVVASRRLAVVLEDVIDVGDCQDEETLVAADVLELDEVDEIELAEEVEVWGDRNASRAETWVLIIPSPKVEA